MRNGLNTEIPACICQFVGTATLEMFIKGHIIGGQRAHTGVVREVKSQLPNSTSTYYGLRCYYMVIKCGLICYYMVIKCILHHDGY